MELPKRVQVTETLSYAIDPITRKIRGISDDELIQIAKDGHETAVMPYLTLRQKLMLNDLGLREMRGRSGSTTRAIIDAVINMPSSLAAMISSFVGDPNRELFKEMSRAFRNDQPLQRSSILFTSDQGKRAWIQTEGTPIVQIDAADSVSERGFEYRLIGSDDAIEVYDGAAVLVKNKHRGIPHRMQGKVQVVTEQMVPGLVTDFCALHVNAPLWMVSQDEKDDYVVFPPESTMLYPTDVPSLDELLLKFKTTEIPPPSRMNVRRVKNARALAVLQTQRYNAIMKHMNTHNVTPMQVVRASSIGNNQYCYIFNNGWALFVEDKPPRSPLDPPVMEKYPSWPKMARIKFIRNAGATVLFTRTRRQRQRRRR